MVSDSDMLVLDMPDMVVMDLVIPVLDTDTVLDTTARDRLMLNQRLRPMLDFFMEDMDMVLDLDMLVLDMPDMVVMDSNIPVLDTDTVFDTMARDPLMLNQSLRPMLDFFMEDTDMVLAMLVLAMPVLVMVMVDMVLDTEVSTMVKKQHLKAHKSSKAICYSVPNYWIGIVI